MSAWDEIMAVVTLYQQGIQIVVERSNPFLGWSTALVKCALVTSSYTPSQSHSSYADISPFEISGGTYTLGGLALSSKTVTTVTNQLRLDAADVSWTSLPVKPRYAVIYDATNATANQRTLLGYLDLGRLKSTKLRIRWPSQGVLTLTVENAIGFP